MCGQSGKLKALSHIRDGHLKDCHGTHTRVDDVDLRRWEQQPLLYPLVQPRNTTNHCVYKSGELAILYAKKDLAVLDPKGS